MKGLRLGLSLTGARSPYAAYALALDFDDSDYWASGTRYAALSSMPGYTYTRTGEQGAVDSDGTVDWFAANAPAINGAGYHAYGALTNSITHNRDLTQADWVKRGTSSVTTDGTLNADGTGNASKVTVGAIGVDDIYHSAGASSGGQPYFLFKKVSATGTLNIHNPASGTEPWSIDLSLVGSGWELISRNHPAASASAARTAGGGIQFGAASGTLTFYVDVVVAPWSGSFATSDFPDGGPLIRTTTAAASIGASALAVSLANGTYSATYTFDDDTTQNNPALVIADGTLNLPADFTPNRNIAKQLLIP